MGQNNESSGAARGQHDSEAPSCEQRHSEHGHAHSEHGHAHSEHGHAHSEHGHGQGEHPTGPRNPALARGQGAGRLVHFDAFSGIAGDMTLAALLDLGVPLSVIESAVRCLPVDGFSLEVGHKWQSGILATTFDVHIDSPQPERRYVEIDEMIEKGPLADGTRTVARAIFRRLALAEADVHGIDLDKVHFHEVGAVDSIVDIVGAAAAFDWLGASVSVSPLPMGHGTVRARHGVLPLPAPATVGCLRGVPTYGVDVEAELVTPTGAAIAASIAERFERWPSLVPERVGWGAGSHELPGRPNLLRVVLGQKVGDDRRAIPTTHVVVEANVDDLTGEVAARAIEMLLAAGALDAWAEPIVMKKGRPALTLAALGRADQLDALSTVLLTETSSIGVRHHGVGRTERPRRTVDVDTPFGAIPVKVSEGPFGPAQMKPEFDACARAAEAANVPVREVIAAALVAARTR